MYSNPLRKDICENEFVDVCSMDEEDKENFLASKNSTLNKTASKRNCLTTSNYCTLLTATEQIASCSASSMTPLNLSQNSSQASSASSSLSSFSPIPTTSTAFNSFHDFKLPISTLQQQQQFSSTTHSSNISNTTTNFVEKFLEIEENGSESEQEEENQEKHKTTTDSSSTTGKTSSTSNNNTSSSRKEKSLGKLCKRFLLAMCEEAKSGKDVHLETVSKKMNVEKRRIYDIVNVMEALEAMSKTNKSFYKWHGLSELPQLMHTLVKEADEEKLPQRILRVEHAMCSFIELSPASSSSPAISCHESDNTGRGSPSYSTASNQKRNSDSVGNCVVDNKFQQNLKKFQNFEDTTKNLLLGNNANFSILSTTQQQQQTTRERNGKNSLAQLCRRFLMVLLCNPKDKRRVSLDVASTVLIKDPLSEGCEPPSRSRCRRLYDIANVLVAMGLIKKVHYLFGTKKIPLFVYCGPEPNASPEAAHLSMMEFLSRIGLPSIGSGANSNNTNSFNKNRSNSLIADDEKSLQMVFEKPVIVTTSCSSQQQQQFINSQSRQSIRPKPVLMDSQQQQALSLKTHLKSQMNLKRKHSDTYEDENKENCGKKPMKMAKIEGEKLQLPKPLPRFISTAQQQHTFPSSLQQATMLQNLRFCQQQQQNHMAQQQQQVEQIFRAAAFLPYAATNAQISPFLWPASIQQQQQQNLTTHLSSINENNKPQQQKSPIKVDLAKQKSPLKNPRQKVAAYSVSSILGVSQAENISPNFNVTKSPRAFKPLNSSTQQQFYSL